nr:hypothetical protein [Tanacetum cinerariifolium]
MILSGANNRPPMLDKDLYDSLKSRMELYMQNKEHERMILESIENGPLIWPTVEENGVTRTKKYAELSAEKIQADCDMKATNIILQGLVVPVYSPGDDLNACLNKAMAFLIVVASSSFGRNNASGQTRVVKCYNCQGEGHMARQCTQTKRSRNATWYKDKAMLAEAQEARKTEDLDIYDSDCNDVSNAKAVLMENISNYGFDVISEEKANKEHNNESLTAELERYKERVKTFEQHLNIHLSSREKMIDSQMDDMIKEKLALKEQVDSLGKNLSNQIKEKECLLQTFTVYKSKSKVKEDKYMENEIDFEKKIKEIDNFTFKVGQSALTVDMLTKPQAFYDNIHKQALGYQNLCYLKKAQWIKPTLYDGIVISNKHVAMPVIDDEETLILKDLNKIYEDFRKRFVPQQKLSADETLWYHMLKPSTKSSDALPVKIEAPKELPK